MKLVHAERNGEAFDSQLVTGVRESYGKQSYQSSNGLCFYITANLFLLQ